MHLKDRSQLCEQKLSACEPWFTRYIALKYLSRDANERNQAPFFTLTKGTETDTEHISP